MSMFGYYFVELLLRDAGWPRKLILFKGEGYNTGVADAVIDQMVDWAASLGARRPALALQVIAEMSRDGDWTSDAPQIKGFIDGVRESWDRTPNAAPREIVQPIRLQGAFGISISVKNLQDARVPLEQNVLWALLWGLANPARFRAWYESESENNES